MAYPSVIEVEHLNVRYNSEMALTDVTFTVSTGDYVGLVGPNGAGKTTLIKALLGLLAPESGRIEIFGQPVNRFSEWSRIGYLPQRVTSFNPLFPATVKEVVGIGLLGDKPFPKRFVPADGEKIRQALNLLEISHLRGKLVSELSGGEQQRVFLARAIVSDPGLLILDEPVTALDPQTRDNFFAIINRFNREKGTTIIMVTHDVGGIGQYANKFLYLDKKLVFYGPFSDFCRSPEMSKHFGDHSQHVICHQHD
ncbi:MAG: metal ABC transporter ATP-binding protein [bacterium]|nr:metal ABC transporter ATP-binding protein [bacterium]